MWRSGLIENLIVLPSVVKMVAFSSERDAEDVLCFHREGKVDKETKPLHTEVQFADYFERQPK